jgi:hypothetical protein
LTTEIAASGSESLDYLFSPNLLKSPSNAVTKLRQPVMGLKRPENRNGTKAPSQPSSISFGHL